MLRNKSQILGMYDEMSVMYGQLDAYKHQGSRLDRSTLLDLYNGGSWSRNFKNRDQDSFKMQETSFNMCGFIQPTFIVNMLESKDPDAFNDRQFFVCPPEVEYRYNDLMVPIDPTITKLEDIFKLIKNAHRSKVNYTLDSDAKSYFIQVHDELCSRKLSIVDDEDRRGILSKAKGQLARLSMVIHSIEQALLMSIDDTSVWKYEISCSSVREAKVILDYIINQKFALMQPEVKLPILADNSQISTGSQLLDDNPKYLSKFLSFKAKEIAASDVSKYRLMPPVATANKNKYPVDACRTYMREVARAGYGNLINDEVGSRRSMIFCKRQYSEIGDEQQETIKRMNISVESYDSFLLHSTSTSSSDGELLLHSPECSCDSQE